MSIKQKKLSAEGQRKLQKFYDEWVKPVRDTLPSKLLVRADEMLEEYSLVK